MKTIRDVFSRYQIVLDHLYDKKEIEAITQLVIGEITGISKASVKAFPEKVLLPEQLQKLKNIINELKTGKPVQYALGKTEFYGLPFFVDRSVLIPRPETEELVEWAVTSVGGEQWAAGSMLDIGTGSGCIAISLKSRFPQYTVSAIDNSSEALITAKKNADLNGVNVNFIQADVLNLPPTTYNLQHATHNYSPLTTHHSLLTTHNSPLTTHHSLIISNPPYVTVQDKMQMHNNVIGFEPHAALFVPEHDPLIFYKAIADFAKDRLIHGGLLFFEINENYGVEILSLLIDKGFAGIELRKDMNGKDRMIRAFQE